MIYRYTLYNSYYAATSSTNITSAGSLVFGFGRIGGLAGSEF